MTDDPVARLAAPDDGRWSDERLTTAPFADVLELLLQLVWRVARGGSQHDEVRRVQGELLRRALAGVSVGPREPSAPRAEEPRPPQDVLRFVRAKMVLLLDSHVCREHGSDPECGDREMAQEAIRRIDGYLAACERPPGERLSADEAVEIAELCERMGVGSPTGANALRDLLTRFGFVRHAVDAVAAPDNCQLCRGKRGGVPGNENIVPLAGLRVTVCDYCHAALTAAAPDALRAALEPERERLEKWLRGFYFDRYNHDRGIVQSQRDADIILKILTSGVLAAAPPPPPQHGNDCKCNVCTDPFN